VHHEREDGDWGSFWSKSTVEVKSFIEATGLEYKSDFTGMPDHISVETEFMKVLTARESQAWEEDDKDAAESCRAMQKKFFDEHISQWVPGFCDKVIADAKLDFYRKIAELTKEFVMEEGRILSGRL
jgi:TorA maturation chaperone TorD